MAKLKMPSTRREPPDYEYNPESVGRIVKKGFRKAAPSRGSTMPEEGPVRPSQRSKTPAGLGFGTKQGPKNKWFDTESGTWKPKQPTVLPGNPRRSFTPEQVARWDQNQWRKKLKSFGVND